MNLKIVKTQVVTLNNRKKDENQTEKPLRGAHNDSLLYKRDSAHDESSDEILSQETTKATSMPNIDEKKAVLKAKISENQTSAKQKLLARIINRDAVNSEQPDDKQFLSQITPKRNPETVDMKFNEESGSLKKTVGLKISSLVNKESPKNETPGNGSKGSKKEIKTNQTPKANPNTSSFSAATSSTQQSSAEEVHKENAPYTLSDEEIQTYGDRCPKGFKKIGFLGR